MVVLVGTIGHKYTSKKELQKKGGFDGDRRKERKKKLFRLTWGN